MSAFLLYLDNLCVYVTRHHYLKITYIKHTYSYRYLHNFDITCKGSNLLDQVYHDRMLRKWDYSSPDYQHSHQYFLQKRPNLFQTHVLKFRQYAGLGGLQYSFISQDNYSFQTNVICKGFQNRIFQRLFISKY